MHDNAGRSLARFPRPTLVILLLGLMVTGMAWQFAVYLQAEIIQARFKLEATDQSWHIRKEFEIAISALRDLAAVDTVFGTVSSEQYKYYAVPIITRQDSLVALGWQSATRSTTGEADEIAITIQSMEREDLAFEFDVAATQARY